MNSQPFFAKDKRKPFGAFWLVAWLAIGAFFLWKGLRPDETNYPQLNTSPAALSEDSSRSTKPIEQVRVGDRVTGRNPDPTDADRNIAEPEPATWRKIELQMHKASGKTLDIVLLRPTTWIESTGAAIHRTIHLDMEEMGAVGPAEVVSIGPCPLIQPGPGQVVTGTFSHEPDDNLVNVRIEGLSEPIGCTDNHRFWSESRQEFVEAGDLEPNAHVRTRAHGLARVQSVTYRPPEERVYNLEVYGEHVYEVSTSGVLVHNSYSNAVVIGEDMLRVSSAADGLGARIIDVAHHGKWTVGKNRQWMGRIISNAQNPSKGGIKRILDIGPAGGGRPSSAFYRVERAMLEEAGYVREFMRTVTGPDGRRYRVYEWVLH